MYGPATAGTMHQGSPRQWPYASSNSPLPLPEHPVLFTRDDIVLLDRFSGEVSDDLLEGTLLKDYVSQFGTATTSLDDLLQELDAPLIADRRPILLQGELANPYRCLLYTSPSPRDRG